LRLTSLALLSSVALFSRALFAQTPPPEIRFESVPNPLKLPAGLYLGEATGIALNSQGHIFVFTRSRQSRLFEFDANGNYLREIGQELYGFVFAHDVRIDKDDNIWCVDEGSNMVIKFNPQGQVIMVIGRRPEAVEGGEHSSAIPPAVKNIFNRPTDIAWDAAGNGYISDGYNNSRVVKVDKEGRWVKSWGTRGTEPGQFHTVHAIATDNKGNVYVGDRENHRIQVFDGEGKFLKMFTNVGDPWALCITPNQTLYASDSRPGRIYKMDLDGNIKGVFGKEGKLPGEFGWVHEIACPNENTLYVSEILNWRVQKLTLHP
jgi:DNA-binding beta-propeller fold protein YncE